MNPFEFPSVEVRMKRLILILLFAAVSIAICTAQATIRNFRQEGMGSQDANTEEKLVITHPSLPLGTQVRVVVQR
jgi:hypothetical protein